MLHVNTDYLSPCQVQEFKTIAQKNFVLDKELSYTIVNKGYILPSYYFFQGGVINEAGLSVRQGCFNEQCCAGTLSNNEVIGSSASVIFLGFFHNVWGHCLMDSMKKLWFLETDVCKQLLSQGAKLVFITPNNEELKATSRQLLEYAGVNFEHVLQVKIPTQFNSIYIPDNSLICSDKNNSEYEEYFYTKEFQSTYNLIRQNLDLHTNPFPKHTSKIYLTRTHIHNNLRDMGESSIEKVFKKLGYEVISPEKLSLLEQYAIIKNVTSLVTTEGSISHNALFCAPGTNVVLIRKSYFINGYQNVINEMQNLNVTYIDAHHSLPIYQFTRVSGPFYMCITPELEKYVGHKIMHLPLWMRPSWWWYCNRNRKIVHQIKRLIGIEDV